MHSEVQSVRNGAALHRALKPSARNGTTGGLPPATGRLPAANGKPELPAARPILRLPHPHEGKRKLILRCWYSLGDITLLTAAIRELHHAHPGRFLTDLRTPFDDLWLHNPHVTPLREDEAEVIECNYALLSESNTAPFHAIHRFTENLAAQLGVRIRPALFRGDIHLHPMEKAWMPQVASLVGAEMPYWIIAAGGKTDISRRRVRNPVGVVFHSAMEPRVASRTRQPWAGGRNAVGVVPQS